MLELIIGFAVGAIFGAAFGVCVYALISAGKEDDVREKTKTL